MYTIDTNAIIYYLKKEPLAFNALNLLLKRNISIYVSSVTEIELLSFQKLTQYEIAEIEKLLSLLAYIPIIPIDSRIAKISGSLRRYYNLKLADSAVAATAIFTGTILITRNVNDFKKIPNLKIQKI